MTTAAPLPTMSDVEASFRRIAKNKDKTILSLGEFARVQDMAHATLAAGDFKQFEIIKNTIHNISSRPGLAIGKLDQHAYDILKQKLEFLAFASSMSPDGKLLPPGEYTLYDYLHPYKASFLSRDIGTVAEAGNWHDYTLLLSYLSQTADAPRTRNAEVAKASGDLEFFHNLNVSFSLYAGRRVCTHIAKLLKATKDQHIPDMLAEVLRLHQKEIVAMIHSESKISGDSLRLLGEFKRHGLNDLLSATIQRAEASFELPHHFLLMEAYGVTKDKEWHSQIFQTQKEGNNSPVVPQLVAYLVNGGDAFLPPFDEIPITHRLNQIVEACNAALKINPSCLPRIIDYLESNFDLQQVGKVLVDKGLDEEISKVIPDLRGPGFTAALGV